VAKKDFDAEKVDFGYRSAAEVCNDMKDLFDRTAYGLQREMQGHASLSLSQFAGYAQSVGKVTQELTDACIDKQRDLAARLGQLEAMVATLTQEQGGRGSQLAARHLEGSLPTPFNNKKIL